MGIIVQKYGGSSVADTARLRRVADKIVAARRAGHDVVVVVSAMGDTTDDLVALSREISPEAPRREMDMLLSVGERISMALLSMAIQALGEEAISLTGSQSGIITNDAHANARIIDVRPFRIQDELARGRVVIVAGYQGTSYKREITTLGRGGSDTTAVALAGALGAEACEIYSDVDGVYTSDPRVVLDATRLSEMTHSEMLELARQGAKVLNAEAIAFAQRHQIALHARSTHAGGGGQGTVVRPDGWPQGALARVAVAPRGVAALERVIFIHGAMPATVDLPALLAARAPAAEVLLAELGEEGVSVVLDPTNLADAAHVRRGLAEALAPEASARDDLTTVALIGREIGASLAWTAKAKDALSAAGLHARRLWTRRDGITALVPVAARAEAMRALHALVVVDGGGGAQG